MIDRVEAKFFRGADDHGDRVFVELSRPVQLLNFDFETAFAWAKTLIRLGEEAQRVGAGHARMSRREIDQFEESILGTPTLRGS